MQFRDRNTPTANELYQWPQPLSPTVLKVIKITVGLALVFTLLYQTLPPQGIGFLMNHLLTVLIFLSWAGPARRMLKRRAEQNGRADSDDGQESSP